MPLVTIHQIVKDLSTGPGASRQLPPQPFWAARPQMNEGRPEKFSSASAAIHAGTPPTYFGSPP